MARTLLALRHVAFEDLGLLEPLAKSAGWTVTYRDATVDDVSDPALAEADLVAVLGGPIGIYETDVYPFLVPELKAIEARLKAPKPVLGICLGAQAMAAVLGARVYFGGTKEIGFGRISLTPEGAASVLAPLGNDEARVLHWHGDTFDLPVGAVRLASNENYPNQAFSYGASLALQFHLEADPERLERWLVGHAVELAKAGIDIPALRHEASERATAYAAQSVAVFAKWLAGI